MQIKPAIFGVLVLAVFLGTVAVASATGAWATTGRTEGGGGGAGGGRVELGSGADPGEVKGWMAVGDVADAFGIPLADLLDAFALPPDTARSTAVKDLESDAFSVSALRSWLGERAP